MDKRISRLDKAGKSIADVLEKNKLLFPYKMYQIKINWKYIMGPQIAKYSYIREFKKDTVVIGVLNSVWMNHLFLYKKKIIDTINNYAKEKIVQDIIFLRSGKKNDLPVYEMEDGVQEKVFPEINIKNMVLRDDVVEKINEETEYLPDNLKEKMRKLRFSQEKRKAAYRSEKFITCPKCGRWIKKEEKLCFLCRLKEKQAIKKNIYDILMGIPWLSYKELKEQVSCSELLYNEVRRDCIYRLIDKICTDSDTKEDDLFLALFIVRKDPSELTEKFIENLTEKYRRNKNVSSYRR